MSTSFDVYPGQLYIPSFKELLDLSNRRIFEYLSSIGVFREVSLNVGYKKIIDDHEIKLNLTDNALWDEATYAWFYIDGVAGGTDAYYYESTDIDKDIWKDELRTNKQAMKLKEKINKSLEIGYHWSFRRSAGQPGIIHLAYGLIAASLTELTDGFIYSDDGAWDYAYFPAYADDFFSFYFKPEFTSRGNQEWIKNSIQSMRTELDQVII